MKGAHTKWIQKRRQKEDWLILHPPKRRKRISSGIDVATGPGRMIVPSQQQKRAPENSKTKSCFDVIDIPGRHDVCLGRGPSFHQHAGNVAMRAMMGPLVNEYKTATSSRRHEMNKIMLQAIHLLGGRFVTNNQAPEGAWFTVESDNTVIESSIGSIFRSMVARTKANRQEQASPASFDKSWQS
jgi:hypothetical protein